MMVTLFGKMVVRTTHEYTDRAYNEALLRCAEGRFRVKSARLASLVPGEYEGFFTVMKIEPYCHHAQGKFLLELEAFIEKWAFTSQPEAETSAKKSLVQHSLFSDTDTFEADNSQIEMPVKMPLVEEVFEQRHEESGDHEDEALFGELYPLHRAVRLDMSQDRNILRQQVDRLREIGYQFDAKAQQWVSQAA